MIVCFSGRFDRPHAGHVAQIMRLGQEFDKVIIPVLDYPEQKYPVQYRVAILKEILSMAKGLYCVYANKEHFARITIDQCPDFDIYASGNIECLKHMEKLGYNILYVNRAYDYGASEDFTIDKIKALL